MMSKRNGRGRGGSCSPMQMWPNRWRRQPRYVKREIGSSWIQNIGERIGLKMGKGNDVFKVKYLDDGETGNITLDSGAGVSVWSAKMLWDLETLAKKATLDLVAVNGSKLRVFHGP